MFQRRMIIVASRLRNATLTQPQHLGTSQTAPPPGEQHDGENGATSQTVSFNSLRIFKHYKNKPQDYLLYFSFFIYLAVGTVFYAVDTETDGMRMSAIEGFYQAITIGYSVGMSPKNPNYEPDPWFSSCYILIGAALIAIILMKIGMRVEESASMNMFEALKRREDYEEKMSRDNPMSVRIQAFCGYNWSHLVIIFFWLVWLGLIIAWSINSTKGNENGEWAFADAQYFAISTCSSAGSISLPLGSSHWAYLLAAFSMMLGVPLMALAVSSIVVMLWQGYRFEKVKLAARCPVSKDELKMLDSLGLGTSDDDEEISKGGYVLLGLLRIGQDAGYMKYLADVYDESEKRGGVLVEGSATDTATANFGYSEGVRAYLGRANSCDEDKESNHGKFTISSKSKKTGKLGWSVTATTDEKTLRQLSEFTESQSSGQEGAIMGTIREVENEGETTTTACSTNGKENVSS